MLFLINIKSYSQDDDMYFHQQPLRLTTSSLEKGKVDERFKKEYEKYVGIWENENVIFKIYTDSIVVTKNTTVIRFKVIKPFPLHTSNVGIVKNGFYIRILLSIHHPLKGVLEETYTAHIIPFDNVRIILELYEEGYYSAGKNIMYQKLLKH